MQIEIIRSPAPHQQHFIDVIAIGIRCLQHAGTIIFSQHLPVIGIVIQAGVIGYRIDLADSAAQGIIRKRRHRHFRLAVQFGNPHRPVLVIIGRAVAVFILRQAARVVISQ